MCVSRMPAPVISDCRIEADRRQRGWSAPCANAGRWPFKFSEHRNDAESKLWPARVT